MAPGAASNVLSAVLVNGTITGPFVPAAPSWICDAVAVMPVTVTLAVTDRSGLMSTTAVPVASVVTGGTSLAPASVRRWPPTIGAIVAQLAINPTVPARTRTDSAGCFRANAIMTFSFVVGGLAGARVAPSVAQLVR